MINAPSQILKRGVDFVRNNPQIIYTLFLVVAIPLAFFVTSEKFLKVATDNQNRLERSRIGLLQDTFALFAGERMDDPEYLHRSIKEIAESNETMMHFQVLGVPDDSGYPILTSLNDKEIGTALVPDALSSYLLGSATPKKPDMIYQVYASEFFIDGARYWRSVRAIPATSSKEVVGYLLTDISMAQADAVSQRNIRNAYLVLAGIIFLIIILLGRQARIIDYASLYARLKQVDQMKDDFVSMAAHELRSPLTIIRGYVEMLGEGAGMSDASKVHLQHIDRAALQLNSLIGDILDVAKLQEGRMSFNFTALDVSQDIAQVVDSFMRPAQDKGLTLLYTPAPLPSISVDTDRFRQLMINLVGNAIKYTPQGEVRVTTAADAEHVTIRVSDTGMGISAEDQQKLFQKFFRVKSQETEKITGTGLGLWITTQIVKAMKGVISVESIKGKGTDFIVTFPIAK
jgi:signal transduction histidine kinase